MMKVQCKEKREETPATKLRDLGIFLLKEDLILTTITIGMTTKLHGTARSQNKTKSSNPPNQGIKI
jgi:hypothetical protein